MNNPNLVGCSLFFDVTGVTDVTPATSKASSRYTGQNDHVTDVTDPSDDRRWCADCSFLDGSRCWSERIEGTGRYYSPWQGLPRRCGSFTEIKND